MHFKRLVAFAGWLLAVLGAVTATVAVKAWPSYIAPLVFGGAFLFAIGAALIILARFGRSGGPTA